MELKEKIEEDSIDVNKFFNISSNVSSDFFNNLFKDSIKTIIIKKEKEDPFFIFINLIFYKGKINRINIFNKNTANYFNIVHGGSIGLLFENITHMLLFYLTKNTYNTKDINILYKRQVLLNIEYTLQIKFEKIKFKTVFIHCNLYKESNKEESTEANIIAEKEIINKI